MASLRRIQDFLNTHADALGTITTSEPGKEVNAVIDEVVSHEVKQGSASRALLGQMSRQRVLAKQLIEKHMQPITRFARGKLRGVPGYADLTVTVSATSPRLVLTAARTMAATAEKYSDQFVRAGLAADTVERLKKATDEYLDAMDQRSHARGLRLVSTDAIEKALVRGRDAVRLLDAQMMQQVSAEDPLLTAWRSISRVEVKAGKTRTVVPAESATTG